MHEKELLINRTFLSKGKIKLDKGGDMVVSFREYGHNNFALREDASVEDAISEATLYFGVEFQATGKPFGKIATHNTEITHILSREIDEDSEEQSVVYFAQALRDGKVFNEDHIDAENDEEAKEVANAWFEENQI